LNEAGIATCQDEAPAPAGHSAGPLVGPENAPELSDRQCLILETMLTHEITSERRRESRAAVVKLVNRKHNPQNYNRDFAGLVKLGYLRSREGPEGGVWIAPQRKAEVQLIISSD